MVFVRIEEGWEGGRGGGGALVSQLFNCLIRFRPMQCYEALNAAGKPVEVVFISLDRSEEDFQVLPSLLFLPHQKVQEVHL